jgi:ArsR family transcriptional regulator
MNAVTQRPAQDGRGAAIRPPWSGLLALNDRNPAADDRSMNTSTAVELSPAEAAQLLAVVADPVRWRLLHALTGGRRCVCELLPVAGVTAPAPSHHLKMLRGAGLVTATRRGRWIDYTLAGDVAQRLRHALPTAAASTADSTSLAQLLPC